MIRGTYSYASDGDLLRHGFSGSDTTIDYQIPAGNLTQLNMLGSGNILNADWATAGTDIPAQLHAINAAMIQLTGLGLAHVIVTSLGWHVYAGIPIRAAETDARASAGDLFAAGVIVAAVLGLFILSGLITVRRR